MSMYKVNILDAHEKSLKGANVLLKSSNPK